MTDEIPPFWWQKAGWQAWLLWPAAIVVGQIAARRLRARKRDSVDLPVLCIAALAIGATGRTEVAMALAAAAQRLGLRPGLIAAGSSGAFSSTHLVDLHHDIARHVGDDALQLARAAPTVLCSDRASAARVLAAEGCDLVIVADGRVGDRLLADQTLIVVDAARGIGNGHVAPAGPVRAPLIDQLRHASAVLKLGDGDGADRIVRLASRAGRPVYEAAIVPLPGAGLRGRSLLAFAGTAAPEQLFDLVRAAGGEIDTACIFADGHLYADDELQELTSSAAASGSGIVTTARDAARLRQGSEAAEDFRARIAVLETELAFELAHIPETIIRETLEARRRRQFA